MLCKSLPGTRLSLYAAALHRCNERPSQPQNGIDGPGPKPNSSMQNPREPACYMSGSCVPCIFGVPRCCNLGQEPGTRNQGTKSSDAACLPYWNSMREKGHADRTKVHMHKRTGQKRRGKKELLETKRDGARLVGSFSGRLFSEADSRFYGGTHVYVRPLFFLRF